MHAGSLSAGSGLELAHLAFFVLVYMLTLHTHILSRRRAQVGLHMVRPLSQASAAASAAAGKKCTDPYTNLAFEDWLLRTSDPDSYVLYLWRNRPTIVIGRNQNPWKECNLGLMSSRGVQLARRSSGGGSVYHDLGNTNYTVVLPRAAFARDLCASMVARALQDEDIPAYVNARHDVAVDGKKVSGSAFKLTSRRAFHHGTMLIDTDLERLNGCLRSRVHGEITALGVDSVRSSVANLREYSWAIDHLTFCNAVMREFSRTFGMLGPDNVCVWDEQSQDTVGRVEQESSRLRSWQWLYGQTPRFVHAFEKTFAWAQVLARITVYHGVVAEVSLEQGGRELPGFDSARQALVGAPYEAAEIERRLAPVRRQGVQADELCTWLVGKVSDAASGAPAPVSGDSA
ncbi:hypothetical protein GGI15_000861 [Coemansia interrupta]|uniref:Putative lipoate-protein ligase A n=1 Tax=Coemansia interrupta TaxID=1126814 RepID=A0A9W8HSA6_9FUNG|nr:hypothetical protein GGI15_000861 [Coemansia interrupta]